MNIRGDFVSVPYHTVWSLEEIPSHTSHSFVFSAVPSLLTVQAKMTATLIPVILAQYYVWPVAQLLSFKLVPPSLRVLYTDGISVFWNCFMCAQMAR